MAKWERWYVWYDISQLPGVRVVYAPNATPTTAWSSTELYSDGFLNLNEGVHIWPVGKAFATGSTHQRLWNEGELPGSFSQTKEQGTNYRYLYEVDNVYRDTLLATAYLGEFIGFIEAADGTYPDNGLVGTGRRSYWYRLISEAPTLRILTEAGIKTIETKIMTSDGLKPLQYYVMTQDGLKELT